MRIESLMRVLSIATAGIICAADAGRSADTEIAEPAFGYSYFLSQASFQQIRSVTLGSACMEVAKKHFFIDGKIEPRLYLYGEYRNGDVWLRIVGDAGGTAIFTQRGESCAVAPVDMTFSQAHGKPSMPVDPPYLSRQEIEGIFADLLRRYATAFGGRAKFFAWLDPLTKSGLDQCKGMAHAYCHPTWHDLPSNLQAMLQKFRGRSNI